MTTHHWFIRRAAPAVLVAFGLVAAACGSDDGASESTSPPDTEATTPTSEAPETTEPASTEPASTEPASTEPPVTGAPDEPLEPLSIRLAVDGFTGATQVWVALANGYFDDEALEVETVPFQTGFEALQSLPAGEVDAAWALDFAAVSSSSPNLAIHASVMSPMPGFHKMTFAEGITAPADLAGGKLGIIEGTAQSYVSSLWLEQNGLSEQVELIPLPGPFELVVALKTGEIQGSFLFGASVAEVTPESGLTVYGDDSEVLEVQGFYMITTSDYASENTEAIARLLRVLELASADIIADPDDAAELTAAAVGGNAAALLPSIQTMQPGIGFTTAQRDQLVSIEQFLKAGGRIPAETDVVATLQLDTLREVAPDRVEF